MKMKNVLIASIRIDGIIPIRFECRKLANGKYRWYGNDGSGARNLGIPLSSNKDDAKSFLLATYPPSQYDMCASWLVK